MASSKKQVSWVVQLGLAAGLCALGGLAYWLEFKHKPTAERQEESSKKVFPLAGTSVESIALENGPTRFEISCAEPADKKACKPGDNAKWKLDAPIKAKADDSNANSLVSALNNLASTEVMSLKEETPEKRAQLLKDYGLAPEARNTGTVRRVIVKTAAGETVAYLGSAHPINENIFAIVERVPAGQKPTGKADETQVFMVPNYFKANLEHDLTYWRDKKLLTLAPSDIQSFKLNVAKKPEITATRKDGLWTLKTPEGEFAGDIENVDSYLTGVAFMTAKYFVSDDKTSEKAKAALKGSAPILTLTLQGAQQPVTLQLFEKKLAVKAGAEDGHNHGGQEHHDNADGTWAVYATVSNLDPLFELQSGARNQLGKTLKDLRLSKLITSVERFSAKKLEFSGKPLGEKALTIVNKDGKWLIQPEGKEANNDKIQGTLDSVSGNRIQEFLTAIPAGEADGIRFTLGDDKTENKRQLVFWKNGGKLYARDLASPRKEAFLVDSAVSDGLPWARNYFDMPATAQNPAPQK